MPWLLHVAMWVLAVASLITLGQRDAHSADVAGRHGADAEGRVRRRPSNAGENPETWGHHPPAGQGDEQ